MKQVNMAMLKVTLIFFPKLCSVSLKVVYPKQKCKRYKLWLVLFTSKGLTFRRQQGLMSFEVLLSKNFQLRAESRQEKKSTLKSLDRFFLE